MFGQSSANAANLQIAREQMAFQERMYKNRHQYEVDDLIAAGLNPILSANSAASAPLGSSAVMQNIVPENSLSSAKELADVMLTKAKVVTEKKTQALLDENLIVAKANSAQAVNDSRVEKSKAGYPLAWLRKLVPAASNVVGTAARIVK